jgi:hypothetical protein
MLDQKADLDCLAEPDLVGQKDTPKVVCLEDVLHQTYLVGECIHRPGVQPAEGVLADEEVGPQPGQAAPCLGWPVVVGRKV